MIISKSPVRITLGGGGTDLESYYSKYGGFLISAAIDKYVFISVNKRFYPSIRLSYSETEIVNSPSEIKHGIFRETFGHMGIRGGIEAVSISDVPANTGLGSSSSFTVSLLNALHAYKREYVSQERIAEEACHIEIDKLKEPIGKQDQYISAFGGIKTMEFYKDGTVSVRPIKTSDDVVYELENNILLFYTGIERRASDVLSDQNKKTESNDEKTIKLLHKIKDIGLRSKTALENGDGHKFGELLNEHWEIKKGLSNKISNQFIDDCYTSAIKAGAVGGKIVGGGGGGVLMFYVDENRKKVIEAMMEMGLIQMKFRFDFEGTKVLVNI